MRRIAGCLAALVIAVVLFPASARAQASIAGIVKDSSGAVLPGVTVEAASDALIEKVRTTVSDSHGVYRIVDLVPGTYTLTFSLASFATVKRGAVVLGGSFTATIDAELPPGNIAETVVVTSEAPLIDLQSSRRQEVLDRDTIAALPATRTFFGLAALNPAIDIFNNAQDAGGIRAGGVNFFSAYGGRTGEGRLQVDGIGVGGSAGGSGTGYYVADVGNAQEVSLTLFGSLGESEVGGPVMNVVPRTGGNTLRGQFYYNYSNAALQADNLTDAIRAANPNLRKQNEIIKFQEINGSFGGPVRKDRLWYYWTGRLLTDDQYATNMFFNKNAGDPAKWIYEPDYNRRAFNDGEWKSTSLRLTLQITSKQKANIFWDEQSVHRNEKGGGAGTGMGISSPEASMTSNGAPQRVGQVTWQSPRTNRLLLEARFNRTYTKYGNYERQNNVTRGLIRVTETLGDFPGITYRSQNFSYTVGNTPRWGASVSYVRAAHTLKVGYDGFYAQNDDADHVAPNDARLAYRFTSQRPSSFTMYLSSPSVAHSRVSSQAIYAQDQWTRGRLTLHGALRFDYARSWYPDQQIGPDRFVPQGLYYPETPGVKGFKDLSPRIGMAYDLFGNGKTSVRANLGRYLEAATNGGITRYGVSNPLNRLTTMTTRTWTDSNGNYAVDCDLMNLGAQNLSATGGDICGAGNANFGKAVFTTTYDPALLEGWGIRPNDWQLGASVQHELVRGVSVELAYNRRMYGLAPLNDNRAVTAADFDPYTYTVPVDPRLGAASGRVIGDLWNVSVAKFQQTDSYLTVPTEETKEYRYWHGVDVNVSTRLHQRLTLRGGVSVGREVSDDCLTFIAGESIFENPSRRDCHVANPFQPRVTGLGVYTIPKIDVLVSATLMSRAGPELSANINVPLATIAATLGRQPTSTGTTIMIDALNTAEMYGARITEVDLRVAKVLRLMGKRATAGFEIYNALNSSDVLAYNSTYSLTNPSTWNQPTSILPPRYAKFSVQVDF